ncbi:MAG: DUF4185 domain-containing protein [Bryobacterales bacterium]|nr:DUF4185 domain-containing protein [Bryobacterales bacterium]
MQSGVKTLAVVVLLLCALESGRAQSDLVSIAMGQNGLTSLRYGGQEMLASGDFQIGYVGFGESATGPIAPGGPSVSKHVDTVGRQITWTYPWGSLSVSYAAAGNRMDMVVRIRNTSTASLRSLFLEPFTLRLPAKPAEYDGTIPMLADNLANPSMISLNYGSGVVVACNEDVSRPLMMGFPWALNRPTSTLFPLRVNIAKEAMYPAFFPYIERPVPPGGSDEYRLSLRFGPPGATVGTLASDILQRYREVNGFRVNWPDRRPIGALFLSTTDTGWPLNPRGWLLDRTLDVFSASGWEQFRNRIISYADQSVAILRNMNAQGMITWDLEGQQYPHATSYIGDPTMLGTLAPEMDRIADEYFRKFRDAGLKVGLTIRPQKLFVSPDGRTAEQRETSDPAAVLIEKIRYAKQRWGATMFYIDSNGSTLSPLTIEVMNRVVSAHPDVLLVPEHENARYYSISAPYHELRGGVASTPVEGKSLYPQAFSVIYTADASIDAKYNELQRAVSNGDILMFRGWFNDPQQEQIKSLYRQAGSDATPPVITILSPSQTAIVSGPVTLAAAVTDNVGVRGVQFRVDGIAVGGEISSYPYTQVINSLTLANGAHTLTATARDEAGNVASATSTFTVSNAMVDGVAPVIAITSPGNGAQVTGTIAVSAAASDNIGVVGVQFKVNGTDAGAEDTVAPFSVNWTSPAPGSYTLTAVARDAAGNRTTSLGVTVVVPTAGNPTGTNGTLAHWKMDETSAPAAADASSNGLVLPLLNGPVFSSGRYGNALKLNGANQYGRLNDSPLLRVNDFSISLWYRQVSGAPVQSLISKPYGSGTDNSFGLFLVNNRLLYHSVGGAGQIQVPAPGANTWAHVAVVKLGTQVRMYVNGALAGASTSSATIQYDSKPLLVGAEDDAGLKYYFGGELDDVRLYNRALSEAEVQAVRVDGAASQTPQPETPTPPPPTTPTAPAPPPPSTPPVDSGSSAGLAGHWKLDESGSTAADSSGNGAHGVVLNGASRTTGKSGLALSLDGVDDHVRVDDRPGLRSNDFSIALWYRTRGGSSAQMLVSKPYGSGTDNSYALFLQNGDLTFHSTNFSGNTMARTPGAGVWTHAVVTKSAAVVRLYINGVPAATTSNAAAQVAFDDRPMLIGAENDGGRLVAFFHGDLDDVRFYGRTLSNAEVAGLAGAPSTPPPAVGGSVPGPKGVRFVGSTTRSGHGDNWHMTWAPDDHQYMSLCDGRGWAGGMEYNTRVLRLTGNAPNYGVQDVPGYPAISAQGRWYGFGILSIGNLLYQFISHAPGMLQPFDSARLVYSPDLGNSWKMSNGSPMTWAGADASNMFFQNTPNRAFSLLSFAQYGRGYQDNTDGYVYVYAPNGSSEGSMNQLVMARVRKEKVLDRSAYEFFASRNVDGSANWSGDINNRGVVHTFPAGWVASDLSYAWHPSVTYNKALGVYLMAAAGTGRGGVFARNPSYLGIYKASNPWGPWVQIHENDNWIANGDGTTRLYEPVIAPKWISADGKSFYLVFSDVKNWGAPWGDEVNYQFNLQQVELTF